MAHSSGTGTFGSTQTFMEDFVNKLEAFEGEHLMPFTQSEAEIYINKFFTTELKEAHTDDLVKQLQELTNFNPKWLYIISSKTSLTAVTATLMTETAKHVDNVKVSLVQDKYAWVQSNILVSMEMLYYASNHISVSNERECEYQTSWVAKEGITYIAEVNDDSFEIRLNYPLISKYLRTMLQRMDRTNDMVYNSVVNGYRFEHRFFSSGLNNELVVMCEKNHSEDTPLTITFGISTVIAMNGRPVRQLTSGALYHLRNEHPVIDAVGRLSDTGGHEWLVLIQVSLSTYEAHRSKAVSLWNKVTYPENNKSPYGQTWLEYYCNLAELEKYVYIYISPKEIGSEDKHPAQTLSVPIKETRTETETVRRKKALHLGLVQNGSKTHHLIKEVFSAL